MYSVRCFLAFYVLAATVDAAASPGMSFLALGDWGGQGDYSGGWTTKGEIAVAAGMDKISKDLGISFVLALGDNIYDDGIHDYGKNSNNYNRWATTFEMVFSNASLGVPWYAMAGNHDHYGDISLEIAYTKKSKRWNFPSSYYNFTKVAADGKTTAEFLVLDSVELSGMSYQDRKTGEFVSPKGPKDVAKAEDQWTWLEDRLQSSTADYLFTTSHYPVWSACDHGSTGDLVKRLRPLLQKYQATGHIAAHDHCLQHITENNMTYVNSGAGAQAWYKADNKGDLKKHAGVELKWYMADDNNKKYISGFAAVQLEADHGIATYYGQDGTLLYTSDAFKPRASRARITHTTEIVV